jgi:hypothetical protein
MKRTEPAAVLVLFAKQLAFVFSFLEAFFLSCRSLTISNLKLITTTVLYATQWNECPEVLVAIKFHSRGH